MDFEKFFSPPTQYSRSRHWKLFAVRDTPCKVCENDASLHLGGMNEKLCSAYKVLEIMEKQNIFIPKNLLDKWEREASEQNILPNEFGEFIRMKKENFFARQAEKRLKVQKVFANDDMTKLTEYGNFVALDFLLCIPEVERACKFARLDFEDLQSTLDKGFKCEMQKEIFLTKRNLWFSHLKERMRDLRISKEVLKSFGLDWNAAKTFAYQTI